MPNLYLVIHTVTLLSSHVLAADKVRRQHNHPINKNQIRANPRLWITYTPTEAIDFKYKNCCYISLRVDFNPDRTRRFSIHNNTPVHIYI